MKKTPSSQYHKLVAGFAASAFALLGLLSMQQHEVNTVSASVIEHATVMTNYRSGQTCVMVKQKRTVQVRNEHECKRLQKQD